MKRTARPIRLIVSLCLLAAGFLCQVAAGTLRRPISPEQPAWIIHIDVWNYADPQKIIDMVPEDVRPFVIFNIATSTNDKLSSDGPAIYDSWMKVCAQNRVWTMIQCASGAANRMPDTPDNVSAYRQYFIDYPNFLGFNFAEQYWGFDSETSVSFDDRLNLFASLLELSRQYGGYLAVSFADSYHNANKMPAAYVKRNAAIRTFLGNYPEHFLCFEKYTQKKNFLDIESHCLGAWLSGIAGQYGIRFDCSGWVEEGIMPDKQEGDTQYTIGTTAFVRAAGAIPIAEHAMLTGQTIIDGPELIWTECSTETGTSSSDGFTQRNWAWFPQFENISLDLFRKILDGTIRIPSRQEVLDRTKVCIVSGGSGSDNASYRTPAALFDGLYRNENDYGGLQGRDANHWLNNRWWMKSTGRYPAIPYMLSAGSLSDISSYVGDTEAKQNYLNSLFEAQYSGNIFAARQDNGWVTYNPFQYDDRISDEGIRTLGISTTRATGIIPLQYNTCSSLQLDYAPYSLGIVREYADHITFYLSNYEGGEDVISIQGATARPTFTKEDRGSATSAIEESWNDGVYTLTINHRGGAVDLTIHCAGNETGRSTSSATSTITAPALPAAYAGVLQYEAELADYKSATIYKTGYGQGRDGFLGQGFAAMNSASSSLRFHVGVPEAGYYLLTLRYQADAAGSISMASAYDVRTINTANVGEWTEAHMPILLAEGQQTIDFSNAGGQATYLDCIQLEKQRIAPFKYSTVDGEYHVDFAYLTAGGNVTFDAATGVASVPAGKAGTLTLLLDAADFSKVSKVILTKSGGDVFNYFTITDVDGVSINNGSFWSSKYNLTYSSSYLNQNIYQLQWVANYSNTEDQEMTISDIVIKVDLGDELGIVNESNGIPAVVPASVSTADVAYTRILTAPAVGKGDLTIGNLEASLYTVCLPYQPPVNAGLKYYTLDGIDGNSLVFVQVHEVSARTPYLVAVTSGSTNVGNGISTTIDFDAAITDGDEHDGFQLKGTLRGLSNADAQGCYILQLGNVWSALPEGMPSVYIPPFRAYIVSMSANNARLRSSISDISSIEYIRTRDADGSITWYDLNGCRIGEPNHKGLYIRNGKMIFFSK